MPTSQKHHANRGRAIIGLHAVREAINVRPRDLTELWLRRNYQDNKNLRDLAEVARLRRVPLREVDESQLRSLAESTQGVACFAQSAPTLSWDVLAQPGPSVILALDEVVDPQNLGSLLRSAWLLNGQAIFITEHRAATLTPAVHKVAEGGAEHVPVVVADPLTETLKRLKQMDYWIYGLSSQGSISLWQLKDLPEKVCWLIGSEAKGIRKSTQSACDEIIQIPQRQAAASLNAAITGAIVLAETARQHTTVNF